MVEKWSFTKFMLVMCHQKCFVYFEGWYYVHIINKYCKTEQIFLLVTWLLKFLKSVSKVSYTKCQHPFSVLTLSHTFKLTLVWQILKVSHIFDFGARKSRNSNFCRGASSNISGRISCVDKTWIPYLTRAS